MHTTSARQCMASRLCWCPLRHDNHLCRFRFERRLITMRCPVCGKDTRRVFLVKRDYWVRQCTVCRHQLAEWVPTPGHAESFYNDDYFSGGGAGYTDYLGYSETLRGYGRRYARLLRAHTEPGLLLD